MSEGKYDPLYKIHSYPTKVPFRAIMRYILHFTKPGDIIYDGFCGTGMTGVAALMCGSRSEFGQIEGKESFYEQGIRNAILCDLSINATHISANYTKHIRSSTFQKYFSEFIKTAKLQLDGFIKQPKGSQIGLAKLITAFGVKYLYVSIAPKNIPTGNHRLSMPLVTNLAL